MRYCIKLITSDGHVFAEAVFPHDAKAQLTVQIFDALRRLTVPGMAFTVSLEEGVEEEIERSLSKTSEKIET